MKTILVDPPTVTMIHWTGLLKVTSIYKNGWFLMAKMKKQQWPWVKWHFSQKPASLVYSSTSYTFCYTLFKSFIDVIHWTAIYVYTSITIDLEK